MRESLSWMSKHTAPQTELAMFDPKEATNAALMAVLERYAKVDGFDNTLARVLIARQRENKKLEDPHLGATETNTDESV